MSKFESSALVWREMLWDHFEKLNVPAVNVCYLVGCLELDCLHRPPPRLSSSRSIRTFSRDFAMQINGARWPFILQCFPRVFGLGFSFHGSSLLCWFCDYELFSGF